MRKVQNTLFIFLLGLFLLGAFSCKSTKVQPEEKIDLSKPDFSVNGGKTLDKIWNLYFETKNPLYLDYIFEYIESEDLFLSGLNENFDSLVWDKKASDIMEKLAVNVLDSEFVCPVDYELLFAFFVEDDEYKDDFKYLYSFLPSQTMVHSAVKSSAFWSVNSLASQYEDVNAYLTKKIPSLSDKSRNTFLLYIR